MKKIFFIFCLIISILFAQDYLNLETSSGFKHADLDDISKITFSGDGNTIYFEMTSGGTASEPIDDIVQILFNSTPQGDQSLPVELVTFKAEVSHGNINLYWETASEENNQGFELQRKQTSSNSWLYVAFIKGQCNSSTTSAYSYTDKNAGNYSDLQYRLKQIDTDGTFEYSEVISVTTDGLQTPSKFQLHKNYPNPFNPTTTITYDIKDQNLTTLKIYNMLGNEIKVLVNKNQLPGTYRVDFDATDLATGIYFCRLTSGNNTQIIKMLMVK